MEFEQVELGETGKRLKRKAAWKHVRKTLLYMASGGLLTFLVSLIIEGSGALSLDSVSENLMMGALFGLFITNSPCARGRC